MMLEMAGRAAQILIALAGAYLVVLWFALIVWTFRDIESRSQNVFTQVFSTLLTVLFFVPGTLLYLLLRPKQTLDEAFQRSLEEEYLLQDLEELPHCPSCHRFVEDDFLLCPQCHTQLREPCASCERLVDLRWPLCPYCGTIHASDGDTEQKVEAPAARWTSPTLRRRRGAEVVIGPRALPEVVPALPRERVAAAASTSLGAGADDTSTFAASLASGMRSIVRPIDRLLGRGDEPVPVAQPGAPVHRNGGTPGEPPANGVSEPPAFPVAYVEREPVPVRNRFAGAGVAVGPQEGPEPEQNGQGNPPPTGLEAVTTATGYANPNGTDPVPPGWGPSNRDS